MSWNSRVSEIVGLLEIEKLQERCMDFAAFQISSVSICYYECDNLYMEILMNLINVSIWKMLLSFRCCRKLLIKSQNKSGIFPVMLVVLSNKS